MCRYVKPLFTAAPDHGAPKGIRRVFHASKGPGEYTPWRARAFPLMIFDPRKGTKIKERLSLQGNPAVKDDW